MRTYFDDFLGVMREGFRVFLDPDNISIEGRLDEGLERAVGVDEDVRDVIRHRLPKMLPKVGSLLRHLIRRIVDVCLM